MKKRFYEVIQPRPMVGITTLFIIGILIQRQFDISVLKMLCGIPILIAGIAFIKNGRKMLLVAVIIIMMGVIRLWFHDFHPKPSLSQLKVHVDSTYQVSAIVEEIGATRRATPKYVLKPYQIGDVNISHGDMILYSGKKRLDLNLGDSLKVKMNLFEPRLKRNPSDFDYKAYLAARSIYLEGFLADTTSINIRPSDDVRLDRFMSGVKKRISGHFRAYLSQRSAGILSALILGERSEVDESTREDFSNTGVIHVLAVSGLHVGYVTLIFITVFGILRPPHSLQVVLVILGLGFYVFLTGSAASVMRASFMAALMLLATLLERRTDIHNTLATAAFIILLIDPRQLESIGFQLSFSAVVSIVSIFPVLRSKVPSFEISSSPLTAKFLNGIMDLFLVSLSAQLGTLAFTIYYFQKIPLISLLANLVVVPTIGLIVGTGMAFLSLGILIPMFAEFWSALLESIIQLMLWFVSICANVPWAFLSTRSIGLLELLLLMIGVFNLVNPRSDLQWKIWILLPLTWAHLLLWPDLTKAQNLEMVMLDVGQGDGLVVHTPNNKTMIVDAGLRFGGKDVGKDVISPYLRSKGIKDIDLLVLSHPHNDHIGGAQYLIENYTVKRVLMQDIPYESFTYMDLNSTIDSLEIPVQAVHAGMLDSSLAPLYLRFTGPARIDTSSTPSNVNDVSIVAQLFYGETTALLTGDAEHEVEKDQLPFGDLLVSDILKAPHHGSKTSSTYEYLQMVSPDVGLISLGMKNKYEHPDPETLEKYDLLGMKVHRTDLEGAVIYHSDGRKWEHYDWRNTQP